MANYIIHNGTLVQYDDELAHYGVKGMKWGVRRYQLRMKARSAYSASSKMIGEKRRRAVMEKGRKYDEAADALKRGDTTKAEAIRKQEEQAYQRAAKLGAAATATVLAAYGGYKLNKFLDSCDYTLNGKSVSRKEFVSAMRTVAKSLK